MPTGGHIKSASSFLLLLIFLTQVKIRGRRTASDWEMIEPKSIEAPAGAFHEARPGTPGQRSDLSLSPALQCQLSRPAPCSVPSVCGLPCDLTIGPERHSVVDLGHLTRMAVMALPGVRGSFRQQAEELFAQVWCIVGHHPSQLTATTMMVFLRNGADEAECREVLRTRFGEALPVTTFAVQPPCDGAALGVELWALGGPGVTVKRFGTELLTVESDGIRWIHCGGICGAPGAAGAYAESLSAFQRTQTRLSEAGIGFDQVVRTWIYVNQINEGSEGRQRYQELNRARTDFFHNLQLCAKNRATWSPATIYPASTGIGTRGTHLTMSCLALDSQRPDVFLMPIENPQQTPACDYHASYSPQAPKFSRAMAVVQGHFVATLVSGTASIVNAQTCHPGDIVRQTEQTIENIKQLIAPENFARHGLPGAGATLQDIAKLRVYVKHAIDYEQARNVCEGLLPRVPALYLEADVCRSDLLVEIEAVAFSPFNENGTTPKISRRAVNGSKRRG